MTLPSFRFHPDPIKSGSVEPSDVKCKRCKQARGFIYVGPVYTEDDVEDAICPWCIADGTAHEKFDVTFTDEEVFPATMPPSSAEEIAMRTPGFAAWQGGEWPVCCGEATAFVEPAGIEEIRKHYYQLEGLLMGYIVHTMGISGGAATRLLQSLHRDRGPTAYVFRCLKCETALGFIDRP